MTTQQRLESHERQLANLTQIAAAALESIQMLERTARRHDKQLAVLIKLAEKHDAAIQRIERQWQAWLSSRPAQ